MVKVYSKPGCFPCKITKQSMTDQGIEFEEFDVSKDEAALARVVELGYLGVPVVETDTQHWQGLQPDKINALA